MNSDKKIETIRKIVNGEESINQNISPSCHNSQAVKITEAGKQHIIEMFKKGKLSNLLEDCTIVIKIENNKGSMSIIHDGITIGIFGPVNSDDWATTIEFPGVSIPFKLEW